MRFSPVLAVAVTMLSALLPSLAWGQQRAASIEHGLFEAVNHERQNQGLPVLKWNDALAGSARKHAEKMAESGTLSHQLPGEPSLPARVAQAGVHHSWLSENIASGTSAEDIHQQFMKSPNHRGNILDSDMDTVGVGVAASDGKWYAVEDFCKAK